ncbi:outer membrane transport energization protein ExbD [Marinobacter daqiaonensis]|uniref:Outer membrane transport energization protein ExbD n=1 Tax=Marinobacter daqiaonensis TaxID=650891 RepID=A0A1I6IJK5_9GAMM|nr:biopolymer transporter ExbD [Marinobacter daqiaonensis]SFR66896.1 outer membrane transport energization protein ExbD [Marinobacter daqiaonensis]
MTPLTPEPFEDRKTLLERVEDSLLPLINLVFLLLMFFIVAGQLTDTAIPELPGMASPEAGEQPEADLVVSADGAFMVANEPVALDALPDTLPQPQDDTTLRIAAASGTAMDQLEVLFRTLEDAGFSEVILLTEPVE